MLIRIAPTTNGNPVQKAVVSKEVGPGKRDGLFWTFVVIRRTKRLPADIALLVFGLEVFQFFGIQKL